jgi:hypothetical protein
MMSIDMISTVIHKKRFWTVALLSEHELSWFTVTLKHDNIHSRFQQWFTFSANRSTQMMRFKLHKEAKVSSIA